MSGEQVNKLRLFLNLGYFIFWSGDGKEHRFDFISAKGIAHFCTSSKTVDLFNSCSSDITVVKAVNNWQEFNI